MKYNNLLIFIPIVFILSNCTSEYVNDGRIVCFEQEVSPILISSCTQSGCHNSSDLVARLDYTTAEGVLRSLKPGSYRNSKIYDAITDPFQPMPPAPYAPLTKEQLITICLWIEQGAKTNVTCTAENCDTISVTYSASIKPILDVFCNGCHAGSNPQGNIDFNTFAGIKATITSARLIGSLNHSSGFIGMPKNGYKLSDCKIATIQKWVDAGAPNN